MLPGTKKRNSGGATSDEDDLLGYLDVAFEREQHTSWDLYPLDHQLAANK
ncbi:hypothetical protein F442_00016 [Phytophthora nicotianae P10297]|uniref:Uncharacterized protein n=1 Tax=Phytophthora nicotianae P10297 TaxID=1317064 RepID=W3A755_PHYNI|nr:hypothetical protein F442_00016 [Phytophthora nicotianae P10297]